MAVTVINRPIGHKLNTTDIPATILDSGGEALVYTGTAHGLQDGDYVYIESNFDAYNGFKFVDSLAYDSFKIRESEGGNYVAFKQSADIYLRVSVLDHGWQCVHLPIVYELESDLWRTNTVEDSYTPRTVSFAADNNGYTGIQGSTNFIGISSLDFIELIGDGPLAGVYQVLTFVDPDEVIIDLAWSADNVFTGYEIRKYYSNYFITVNVYGGIPSGHPWEAEKPVVLLASLKLTPDSNNRVKFSIAEVLKSQITVNNNLTLNTLPNNIDFWTSFYIGYFDSYDTSDGVEVSVFNSDEVIDSFTGYAMNAILPFKSLNSGHMSEYVSEDTLLARWLTTQDVPTAIVDRFFDLSFINNQDSEIIILKNGEEFLIIPDPGKGVLRIPFVPTVEEQACFQALINGDYSFDLSDLDSQTGAGTAWTPGGNPSVSTNASSQRLYGDITTLDGDNYNISVTFDVTGTLSGSMQVGFFDSGLNIDDSDSNSVLDTAGTYTENFTITAGPDSIYLFIRITTIFATTVTVTSVTIDSEMIPLTEIICVNVVEECTGTFNSDDLRLTEGDELRALE